MTIKHLHAILVKSSSYGTDKNSVAMHASFEQSTKDFNKYLAMMNEMTSHNQYI